MQKHWRVLALGALVSGVVIYLIARQIDFALLWQSLRTANYVWLVPAIALTVIGLFTRTLRWRVLLGGGLGLTRAFHILNIAYMLNGVLPLRLGEVGRAWLASRGEDGVPVMRTASTIVVERLLDLLAVAVFIAIGLAIGPVPDALRTTGVLTSIAALGGFLFLVLLANKRHWATALFERFTRSIPGLAERRITPRAAIWLDHLLDGLQPIAQVGSLIKALFWTAVSWGFSFLTVIALMLVFYPQADPVATLLLIASASFAVALPAIPGNIGPYEGSILLAMGALGYTATDEGMATATAFALVVHAANIGVNAALGVIGLMAEGVSLGQIAQRAEAAESA